VGPRLLAAASLTLALSAGVTIASAEPPAGPPQADDDVEVPAAPSASARTPPPPEAAKPPDTPSPSPPPIPAQDPEVAQLRARLDALEARVAREPAHPQVRDEPPSLPTTSFDGSAWSRTWSRGFLISGYVQGQYQQSQLSQDQLDANGTPLNQNRFLVRRARLRFDRGWDYAFATLEVDGNNVNGLAFGLRRAEASLLWRARDPVAPPLAILTVGLTDIPFGYELYEPNRTRLFLERTTASRALFPGDTDFGARLAGAVGFFRYAVGVYDGTPVPDTEPSAAGYDPTSEKDVMARFGAETRPVRDLGVSGGLSFLRGTGFSPGTTATQNSLQVQTQNGMIALPDLTLLAGQAAQPSKTFSRWALGLDVQGRLETPIGRGLLYGEVYVAENYDRGLLVADPVATGANFREVGWYVGYLQEIARYGVVGFRVDAYNPDLDATTLLGGALLPRDQTITTWSPLAGLILPGRARLMFEYDHILNHEGLDSRGVPTDLREDQWALRLQVEM
jgi:hypothetical protein